LRQCRNGPEAQEHHDTAADEIKEFPPAQFRTVSHGCGDMR
jgi:hypothetical protein